MTRALFLIDAGPNVGFGHFRRCLFLFRALQAKGVDCRMSVPEGVSLSGLWSGPVEAWPADLSETEGADILVSDSYRIDRAVMRAWKGRHGVRVVVDDNANRPLDADVVLNHNIYAPELDYGRVCDCPVLAGLDYCLVDPRFAALRSVPSTKRGRIVVSFGGTDSNKGLETAARLVDAVPGMPIDVVVPKPPEDTTPEAEHDRIRLLALPDMVETMAGGAIFVGAAGVTTWEAAAAGLSIVVCRVAANQVHMIPALRKEGIAAFPEFNAGQLAAAAAAEARKPTPGNPLSDIIDGGGAARAATAILGF